MIFVGDGQPRYATVENIGDCSASPRVRATCVASYVIRRRDLFQPRLCKAPRSLFCSHRVKGTPSLRATSAGAGKGKNGRTISYLVLQVAKLDGDMPRIEQLPAVVGCNHSPQGLLLLHTRQQRLLFHEK